MKKIIFELKVVFIYLTCVCLMSVLRWTFIVALDYQNSKSDDNFESRLVRNDVMLHEDIVILKDNINYSIVVHVLYVSSSDYCWLDL
jgi:hypothetical protein